MSRLPSLTLNQKLALAAFVLGAISLFAQPQPGHAVSIAPRDLAVMVQKGGDRVAARDLADWILTGRADFRLVDLRAAELYAAYHIPGAEHVPIASLPDRPFGPTEKVVLYSEDGTEAAQGWFLLRARGARNVYILQGGLASWKGEVLFPALAPDPGPFEQQRNEKLTQIAAHFGGRAMLAGRVSGAAAAPEPPLPVVEAPAVPAGAAAPAPARKKKEGC
jgi:rhodanese-related sulfurtransferase